MTGRSNRDNSKLGQLQHLKLLDILESEGNLHERHSIRPAFHVSRLDNLFQWQMTVLNRCHKLIAHVLQKLNRAGSRVNSDANWKCVREKPYERLNLRGH